MDPPMMYSDAATKSSELHGCSGNSTVGRVPAAASRARNTNEEAAVSQVTNGDVGEHFRGTKRDCVPCALRAQCLRTPETTVVRNVAFFRGRVPTEQAPSPKETHTTRMQQRLDAPEGRAQYGQRFATVEPVFANLRYNKRLDRFRARCFRLEPRVQPVRAPTQSPTQARAD